MRRHLQLKGGLLLDGEYELLHSCLIVYIF